MFMEMIKISRYFKFYLLLLAPVVVLSMTSPASTGVKVVMTQDAGPGQVKNITVLMTKPFLCSKNGQARVCRNTSGPWES